MAMHYKSLLASSEHMLHEMIRHVFPLCVFSIRNFNLRNLKGNGNAVNDVELLLY